MGELWRQRQLLSLPLPLGRCELAPEVEMCRPHVQGHAR